MRKSKTCVFANKTNITSVDVTSIQITINGETIENDKEIKYLGTILDYIFNFDDYLMTDCIKCIKLGFTTRIGPNLSMQTFTVLFNIDVKAYTI